MKTNYLRTKTTVSFLCYHFVFCPRYRRKIFDVPGVEERFKELVRMKCQERGYVILVMECHRDHVHLFLQCPPVDSPAEIMHQIKGSTGRTILNEYGHIFKADALWTRSYFVSAAESISDATIKRYVDTQKTRS